MTDHDDLREAFDEYSNQRPPKDIVPHTAPADASPIPTGTQEVTHYEITEDGVIKHTEQLYITPPITRKEHD